MLFKITPDTPRFKVFTALNNELLTFIENAQATDDFKRELFSEGNIGQACWDNAKANNLKAKNDLTQDKFKNFFVEIQKIAPEKRIELHEIIKDNQDVATFFNNPNPNLLDGFPSSLTKSFKTLASHLYTATKDLQAIIDNCDGVDIKSHFTEYRRINGNVCQACGMNLLSPIRHNVDEAAQWRADYDHQICKSKYPVFAVHPDNLIPLCDICNQDAKKSKDLFRDDRGKARLSFYPYQEYSSEYVGFKIDNLRDPEIKIDIEWCTQHAQIIDKLNTWDDVYEIKSLALGRYFDPTNRIIDAINPINFEHMKTQIQEKARQPNSATFKRQPWTFWEYIFFHKLNQLSDEELAAIWNKVDFILEQGIEGAHSIIE